MQINHIQYERRMSDGTYGHRMLSATAILADDDDPAQVAALLQAFVHDRLDEDEAQEDAARQRERRASELSYEIDRKERELAELKDDCARVVAFLEHAGVDVRDRYGELPL